MSQTDYSAIKDPDNLPEKITITDQFAQVIERFEKSDQPLFITGRAGTGKSTLLTHIRENTIRDIAVVAPTGVAALNVKGQTIHRFFNFSPDVTPQKIVEGRVKPRKKDLYETLDALIIDEISMVRADMIDCIHQFLTRYGPAPGLPFGGVQLVMFGDLYQLPPVVTREAREMFSSYYATPYFFSAQAMRDLPIETVRLNRVFRQREKSFIQLLNAVRNGSLNQHGFDRLNQRFVPEFEPDEDQFYIHLTTTNKQADSVNKTELKALKGQILTAEGEIEGDFGREYLPTAQKLEYKIGAQIMLLNNDPSRRWVNGTIGVIKERDTDNEGEVFLRIELEESGRTVRLFPYKWEVYRFTVENNRIKSEAAGSFTQYPFRLAWAVTIHKSQGKTYDRVILDLGRGAFAPGQLYVGLSRCRTFEGLVLKRPVRRHDLKTDRRVIRYMNGEN